MADEENGSSADDQEEAAAEALAGLDWGPGVYQSLLIVAFLLSAAFSSCNSNVAQVAGPKTGVVQQQANSGFQGHAPQVAESPSPTPADQPTPVQDQPTPVQDQPTQAPACTPVIPPTVTLIDDHGSHTAPSNGSFTAYAKNAGDNIQVNISDVKACGGNHVALTITDHPGNFSCQPAMSGPISAVIGAYNAGSDPVKITAVHGPGC
jgi:hypothetical protein